MKNKGWLELELTISEKNEFKKAWWKQGYMNYFLIENFNAFAQLV